MLFYFWPAISLEICVTHAEKLFTVPAWVLCIKRGFEAFLERKKTENQAWNRNENEIEKKRPKSVKNREFSTVRSPTEDTMKNALNRHFEGRYVEHWV